jgi:uncharacterized membrane protein YphA (DoxX/SURF4 family)
MRFVAGIIFVYAGWEKLRSPQAFADAIAAYQLLPAACVNPMAMALPLLEVILGAMLVTGWQLRIAVFSALLLMGIFMTAIALAVARGIAIECGCFGSGRAGRGELWLALARDAAFATGLLVLYLRDVDSNEHLHLAK